MDLLLRDLMTGTLRTTTINQRIKEYEHGNKNQQDQQHRRHQGR